MIIKRTRTNLKNKHNGNRKISVQTGSGKRMKKFKERVTRLKDWFKRLIKRKTKIPGQDLQQELQQEQLGQPVQNLSRFGPGNLNYEDIQPVTRNPTNDPNFPSTMIVPGASQTAQGAHLVKKWTEEKKLSDIDNDYNILIRLDYNNLAEDDKKDTVKCNFLNVVYTYFLEITLLPTEGDKLKLIQLIIDDIVINRINSNYNFNIKYIQENYNSDKNTTFAKLVLDKLKKIDEYIGKKIRNEQVTELDTDVETNFCEQQYTNIHKLLTESENGENGENQYNNNVYSNTAHIQDIIEYLKVSHEKYYKDMIKYYKSINKQNFTSGVNIQEYRNNILARLQGKRTPTQVTENNTNTRILVNGFGNEEYQPLKRTAEEKQYIGELTKLLGASQFGN